MDVTRLARELDEARRRRDRAVKRLRDGGEEAQVEFRAATEAQLDAERALAATRNEEHAVAFDLGVEMGGRGPASAPAHVRVADVPGLLT